MSNEWLVKMVYSSEVGEIREIDKPQYRWKDKGFDCLNGQG